MGMCPKRLLKQRSSGSPASLRCSVARSVIRRGLYIFIQSELNYVFNSCSTVKVTHFNILTERSKHVKCSKERCLLGQNTTCEFSG